MTPLEVYKSSARLHCAIFPPICLHPPVSPSRRRKEARRNAESCPDVVTLGFLSPGAWHQSRVSAAAGVPSRFRWSGHREARVFCGLSCVRCRGFGRSHARAALESAAVGLSPMAAEQPSIALRGALLCNVHAFVIPSVLLVLWLRLSR